MREYKFKAWLPGIGKMSYAHTLDELMNWNTKQEDNGTAEWLQWTGRKDKNDVEIYKHDIIIDEKGRYGVIYWNDEECSFLVDFQSELEIEPISYTHTVCGNAYENVELLK